MLTILVAAAGLAMLWVARWAARNWSKERTSMNVRMDVLEKGDPDSDGEDSAKSSIRGLRRRVQQLELDIEKAFAIAEGGLWYGGCEDVQMLTEEILRSFSTLGSGPPSESMLIKENEMTSQLKETLSKKHGAREAKLEVATVDAGMTRYKASGGGAPAEQLQALEDRREGQAGPSAPPTYAARDPYALRSVWPPDLSGGKGGRPTRP